MLDQRLPKIAVDEEGFLHDPADWDRDLAQELATQEHIELSTEHWVVIDFIRNFYEQHQTVPEARTLLKHLRQHLGEQQATRKYIHTLFPYGYGQQACKISGMRKPRKLMLDV